MPFDLNHQPIRAYDSNKVLVRAGARWDEPKPVLQWFLLKASWVFAFASLLGFLSAPLWGLFLLNMLCIVAAFTLCQTPRSVVFEVSGRTALAHGLRNEEDIRQLQWHHERIVSVESAAGRVQNDEGYSHLVRLITRKGGTIWVAQKLQEWDALKVAVSLRESLDEIRNSAAYQPLPQEDRPRDLRQTVDVQIN